MQVIYSYYLYKFLVGVIFLIYQNLNNFVQSWLDWNIALDTQGGPSYCGNTVDAPILVNKVRNIPI